MTTMRSAIADSGRDYKPTDLMNDSDWAFEQLQRIRTDAQNRVIEGLLAAAPTTPSVQTTGAAETAWRVNLAAGLVVVAGGVAEFAAEADRILHSATQLVASGQSAVCDVVAKSEHGATPTLVNVKGAAATTGAQLPPTDAAIQTAVGAGHEWALVARCLVNRTADTTLTQSQDNTKRPVLGVNVDTDFGAVA